MAFCRASTVKHLFKKQVTHWDCFTFDGADYEILLFASHCCKVSPHKVTWERCCKSKLINTEFICFTDDF